MLVSYSLQSPNIYIRYFDVYLGDFTEGLGPIDKNHPRQLFIAVICCITISVIMVSVVVMAGLALANQSNSQNESPFLTYPLHVDKYAVQHLSNDSYEFTVWVENQNYSSANSGRINCILILDPYRGSLGFSSDWITVGPGERTIFTTWSPENVSLNINWTSFECGILQ